MLDGCFVSTSLAKLLQQSWFDKNVKLMVAHNANDSPYFPNSFITNKSTFEESLQYGFLAISSIDMNYMTRFYFMEVACTSREKKTKIEIFSKFPFLYQALSSRCNSL